MNVLGNVFINVNEPERPEVRRRLKITGDEAGLVDREGDKGIVCSLGREKRPGR